MNREQLRPTWWPAALALGIVLVLWGIVTSLMVAAVGVAVFAVALAGWLGEVCHARRQRP